MQSFNNDSVVEDRKYGISFELGDYIFKFFGSR
jgi:hypothetical protein